MFASERAESFPVMLAFTTRGRSDAFSDSSGSANARKMMVLGLGDATRALRMISLAQRYNPPDQISFAGIDRFDSRPVEASPFSLKDAHRLLRPTGSRINLIPGDPREALARAATVLHGIDLLVVSADQDAQSLAQGWFFVPRMLAPPGVGSA